METESKKVFVYVRDNGYGNGPEVAVSSCEFDTTYCSDITRTVSAPLFEIEVEVPKVSSAVAGKVLTGAMLDNLKEQREKVRADFHLKLNEINTRIEELQAIECKGGDNE